MRNRFLKERKPGSKCNTDVVVNKQTASKIHQQCLETHARIASPSSSPVRWCRSTSPTKWPPWIIHPGFLHSFSRRITMTGEQACSAALWEWWSPHILLTVSWSLCSPIKHLRYSSHTHIHSMFSQEIPEALSNAGTCSYECLVKCTFFYLTYHRGQPQPLITSLLNKQLITIWNFFKKMYSDNSWSSNLSPKNKKCNTGKSRDDVVLIFVFLIQKKYHTAAHERYPKLANSFTEHTYSFKINASVLFI